MPAPAAALALVVALVPLIGAGGPGPADVLGADRLIRERASHADATLADLEGALTPALEAGRAASARVVAGEDAPGPMFREAAEAAVAAEPALTLADRALGAVEGALHAAGRPVELERPGPAGELASIGAQLEASAAAGDAFAAMRRRAAAVTPALAAALEALDRGAVPEARQLVTEAREHHTAVDGWELEVLTLPVWLVTTGDLVGASEQLVLATERRDADAVRTAAASVAALSDEAAEADRALRIAIGEGGAAIAGAPLGRLADVLRRTAAARAALASIVQTAGR